MMILAEMASQGALILALGVAYSLVYRTWRHRSTWGRLTAGSVFGIAAVIAMMNPVNLAPGLIFDSRTVILAVAGLFGGGLVAFISATIALVCRLMIGGQGLVMGCGAIVTSAALGAGYHHLRGRNARDISATALFVFGLVVHTAMVLWVFTLPDEVRGQVLRIIVPPVMLLYPLGTVLVGKLLCAQDRMTDTFRRLAKSEQQYQDLYDNAPDMFASIDVRTGHVLRCNRRLADMTGLDKHEIIGRSVLDLYHPDSVEEARSVLDSFADRGEMRNVELALRRADGSKLEVSLNATAVRDESGAIVSSRAVWHDITEQRLAREAVQEQLDFTQRILDSSDAHIAVVDSDGTIVLVNKGWRTFARENTPEGLPTWGVGCSYISEYSPDWGDVTGAREAIDGLRKVQSGVLTSAEVEYPCHGLEERRWFSVRIRPLLGAGGSVLVSHVNITSRVLVEEARRESETRFRMLFDNIGSGVSVLQPVDDGRDFVVVDMNPAGQALAQQSAEELCGRRVTEGFPGIGASGLLEVFREVNQTGKARDHALTHYEDGRIGIWVEVCVLKLPSGHIVALFDDISEKRKAEEERERLGRAVEQAAESILITDESGVILYVNPAFERITGYTSEESVGMTPRLLKSGEHTDEIYKDLWHTIGQGRTWRGRIVNRRKDGAIYTEEGSIAPLFSNGGEITNYVAVKRDITEHLRLHEEKADLEERYRQSQKMEAIGQLAGGVAHDFNNLLQVIGGYTEVARDHVNPDHAAHGLLDEVLRAHSRAAALVSQLLAFGRRQTMEPRLLNLNEVASGLMSMLERLLGEHIQLHFRQDDDLGTVYADLGMVEQVIMNLCLNARDAMPHGGRLDLETRQLRLDADFCVDHPWAAPGAYALLLVKDAGCGMGPDIIEHVFEPFFTTKEVGKGTGLGLATIFGIVKQHDGLIHVESKPGDGTTFFVYLPTVSSPEQATEDATEVEAAAATGNGDNATGTKDNATIMLVEDDDMVRAVARETLEREGYTILTARNGREAVQLFERSGHMVDVVLLDMMMPEMNGREAYIKIREMRPAVPALFTSGYSDDLQALTPMVGEEPRLIKKPYTRADLLQAIRDVLTN